MKKSISIIVLLFISLFSFNISAQNIIGTWEGISSRSGESPKDPMKGDINLITTFNADKTGIQSFDGNASANLDQNTKLKVKLRGKFPFTWVQEGSNITMEITPSQFELYLTENDIEIVSSDPNTQAMINAYKPQMVEMLHSQLKATLGTSFSKKSTWTNVKIEGNQMQITDNGVNHSLTRVK